MIPFPPRPLAPKEFFGDFLPRALAEAGLPPGSEGLDVKLGVKLSGPDGGEWLVHVANGAATIRESSREDAAFTMCLSVEDWRGALWEGRGGAIAKQVSAPFRPGEIIAPGPAGLGAPQPAAIAQMRALSGVIRMIVAGGPGGDWRIDLKLGPGAIPEEPTTTVTFLAEDVDRMERGELNPIEAFMAGRIQIAGDMTLMMQMQAIQMQAATIAAAPPLE